MGVTRAPSPRALARASSLLEIDLDAIAANWQQLAAMVGGPARCAAVVKADAYGLGAAYVAPALAAAGCRLFFVATVEEGAALRRALRDVEIAVLNGPAPAPPASFKAARLMPVLNDLAQIERWRRFAKGEHPALLHLDTGMNRLGLSPPKPTGSRPSPRSSRAWGFARSCRISPAPRKPTIP